MRQPGLRTSTIRDRSPVKEHLAVPKAVRLAWGGLKNLLSGVTTVAHHNPYDAAVFDHGFPVRVIKRFGWAHSLRFSPDLVSRYRAVSKRWPFLIHAAEGTDASAAAEIRELERTRSFEQPHGAHPRRRSRLPVARNSPAASNLPGLVPQFESLHAVSNAAPGSIALGRAHLPGNGLRAHLSRRSGRRNQGGAQSRQLERGGNLPHGDHPGRARAPSEPGRR